MMFTDYTQHPARISERQRPPKHKHGGSGGGGSSSKKRSRRTASAAAPVLITDSLRKGNASSAPREGTIDLGFGSPLARILKESKEDAIVTFQYRVPRKRRLQRTSAEFTKDRTCFKMVLDQIPSNHHDGDSNDILRDSFSSINSGRPQQQQQTTTKTSPMKAHRGYSSDENPLLSCSPRKLSRSLSSDRIMDLPGIQLSLEHSGDRQSSSSPHRRAGRKPPPPPPPPPQPQQTPQQTPQQKPLSSSALPAELPSPSPSPNTIMVDIYNNTTTPKTNRSPTIDPLHIPNRFFMPSFSSSPSPKQLQQRRDHHQIELPPMFISCALPAQPSGDNGTTGETMFPPSPPATPVQRGKLTRSKSLDKDIFKGVIEPQHQQRNGDDEIPPSTPVSPRRSLRGGRKLLTRSKSVEKDIFTPRTHHHHHQQEEEIPPSPAYTPVRSKPDHRSKLLTRSRSVDRDIFTNLHHEEMSPFPSVSSTPRKSKRDRSGRSTRSSSSEDEDPVIKHKLVTPVTPATPVRESDTDDRGSLARFMSKDNNNNDGDLLKQMQMTPASPRRSIHSRSGRSGRTARSAPTTVGGGEHELLRQMQMLPPLSTPRKSKHDRSERSARSAVSARTALSAPEASGGSGSGGEELLLSPMRKSRHDRGILGRSISGDEDLLKQMHREISKASREYDQRMRSSLYCEDEGHVLVMKRMQEDVRQVARQECMQRSARALRRTKSRESLFSELSESFNDHSDSSMDLFLPSTNTAATARGGRRPSDALGQKGSIANPASMLNDLSQRGDLAWTNSFNSNDGETEASVLDLPLLTSPTPAAAKRSPAAQQQRTPPTKLELKADKGAGENSPVTMSPDKLLNLPVHMSDPVDGEKIEPVTDKVVAGETTRTTTPKAKKDKVAKGGRPTKEKKGKSGSSEATGSKKKTSDKVKTTTSISKQRSNRKLLESSSHKTGHHPASPAQRSGEHNKSKSGSGRKKRSVVGAPTKKSGNDSSSGRKLRADEGRVPEIKKTAKRNKEPIATKKPSSKAERAAATTNANSSARGVDTSKPKKALPRGSAKVDGGSLSRSSSRRHVAPVSPEKSKPQTTRKSAPSGKPALKTTTKRKAAVPVVTKPSPSPVQAQPTSPVVKKGPHTTAASSASSNTPTVVVPDKKPSSSSVPLVVSPSSSTTTSTTKSPPAGSIKKHQHQGLPPPRQRLLGGMGGMMAPIKGTISPKLSPTGGGGGPRHRKAGIASLFQKFQIA